MKMLLKNYYILQKITDPDVFCWNISKFKARSFHDIPE